MSEVVDVDLIRTSGGAFPAGDRLNDAVAEPTIDHRLRSS